MVAQYISQRQRVFNRLKVIFSDKYFSSEINFFINNMIIELGASKKLIEEAVDNFIEAGYLIKNGSLIKSSKYQEEIIKSDAEKEVESEFKKMGI